MTLGELLRESAVMCDAHPEWTAFGTIVVQGAGSHEAQCFCDSGDNPEQLIRLALQNRAWEPIPKDEQPDWFRDEADA